VRAWLSSSRRSSGLPHGMPCQPSMIQGTDTPSPAGPTAGEHVEVIVFIAGVRAPIRRMPVPSLTCSVRAAR
jgi:hypothetical protein